MFALLAVGPVWRGSCPGVFAIVGLLQGREAIGLRRRRERRRANSYPVFHLSGIARLFAGLRESRLLTISRS